MEVVGMTDSDPVKAYWAYRQMARDHEAAGRWDAAFSCLEAAHILGQRRTSLHVGAHVAMLGLAWREREMKEVAGQILRIAAAALITWLWAPAGNTGRSNVSALQEMPLPEDLRELLADRDKSR